MQDKTRFQEFETDMSGGDSTSFVQIVMRQLSECIKAGGKEMHGGGVRSRVINGQVVEIAVSNTREMFIREVEMMWTLVVPEYEEHSDNERISELINQADTISKKAEKELEASIKNLKVKESHLLNNGGSISDVNEERKRLSDKYELEKVIVARTRLTAIMFLLKTLNYYGEGGSSA